MKLCQSFWELNATTPRGGTQEFELLGTAGSIVTNYETKPRLLPTPESDQKASRALGARIPVISE